MNINKPNLPQQAKESSGFNSVCTKCSISYKTSSSPEAENIKKVGTVDELSCDCDISHNEDQVPLDFNLDSRAILQSIRKKKSSSGKIVNKRIKAELVQLREQVKVLNFRASHCEGELRIKENENNELKDIMVGLKKYLSGNEVDKVAESSCQTCGLF